MSLGTVLWPALLAGLAHTGLGQGHDARVPDPSEASYAHLSTALALDPCGSAYGSDWQDVDSQRAIEQARAQLPRDTCETDEVRGLLFRARFLQYALLARSAEPWQVFDVMEAQRRREMACPDVDCLHEQLLVEIAWLSPRYGASLEVTLQTTGLCDVPEELEPSRVGELLPPEVARVVEDQCQGDFTLMACHGSHRLLQVACGMGGVAVNSPEWLWESSSSEVRLLLQSDEGPLMRLQGSCNGMFDIATSARASMGESHVVHYRYDGTRYREVLSYIRESIDLPGGIATYPERGTRVDCR